MSVREYSVEELGQLYADLRSVLSRLPMCPVKEELLQEVLRAAYIANRTAWACTYNEKLVLEPWPGLPGNISIKASRGQVFQDLAMVLYNCVSNGGRDFLPKRNRRVLEQVQWAIAWELAEEETRQHDRPAPPKEKMEVEA